MQFDPKLTRFAPARVLLELTSRCNLRCVYCALSQPDFHGKDLEVGLDRVLAELDTLHPEEVQISGHGESTIVRDWTRVAKFFRERDVAVAITTNLAATLEPDELEEFVHMRRITVSCDTSDPVLFGKLRRGATFAKVDGNLRRIQDEAKRRGLTVPFIALNCTMTDAVVPGLVDLVRWAKQRELNGVSLVNLVVYSMAPDVMHVRHPAEADPKLALEQIELARRTANDLGLEFEMMGGLVESLEAALETWPTAR